VYLLAAAGIAFVIAFLTSRWMIRRLKGTSMVGRDLHKPGSPEVPEMGGLAVIAGFYAGVTAIQLTIAEGTVQAYLHASLVAAFGAGFVGLLDDLFNLRQRTKAILPFLFALPLATVVYRDPEGGTVLLSTDVGPLVLLAIPLGITSAANAANMLEGFNGLGAGLGIIMCLAMVGLALVTGDSRGLYLVLPLLGALLAFLYFNRYPARIFPGDSMTLFVGATVAAAAIMAHQKTYGALLFVPFILEFVLKARGHFKAQNYGTLNGVGRLSYGGPIESLSHLLMRGRSLKEKHLVVALWALEAAVGAAILLSAAADL
jgi:UDP-N-acetylglucosamine--dolichyl-phosphate N-acetylglucosaminephosphotransferase